VCDIASTGGITVGNVKAVTHELCKIDIVRNSSCLHISDFAKMTLAVMGWKIMIHLPHRPDLAPSDLHLFRPMKVHLGGQKSKAEDELKHGGPNWLYSQDKFFLLLASVTCQDNRRNALVQRESNLKSSEFRDSGIYILILKK
jgi:hypothetical protein